MAAGDTVWCLFVDGPLGPVPLGVYWTAGTAPAGATWVEASAHFEWRSTVSGAPMRLVREVVRVPFRSSIEGAGL